MIGIISIILLMMWTLFIFSIWSENDIFVYIASSALILLSVYIMVSGLEGVNNFVTKGLAVIQIGVGLVGIFAPLWAEINSD